MHVSLPILTMFRPPIPKSTTPRLTCSLSSENAPFKTPSVLPKPRLTRTRSTSN